MRFQIDGHTRRLGDDLLTSLIDDFLDLAFDFRSETFRARFPKLPLPAFSDDLPKVTKAITVKNRYSSTQSEGIDSKTYFLEPLAWISSSISPSFTMRSPDFRLRPTDFDFFDDLPVCRPFDGLPYSELPPWFEFITTLLL